MSHSQSSQLFRMHSAQIPQHTMHVYARMVTTMYLVGRYKRAKTHSARLAKALERMDQQLWLANRKGEVA